MLRKRYILFFLILIVNPLWAGEGTIAKNYPEDFTMSSGLVGGLIYSISSVAGENAIGTMSTASKNYNSSAGLVSTIYANIMPGPDIEDPEITNLKFDGRENNSGDYVNGNVVITAKITDASGIDTSSSAVIVDGVSKSFSSLAAPSSYNALTGQLVYSPAFSVGTHTFSIFAQDVVARTATTEQFTLYVSDGELRISGEVYNYPNPFSPPSQTTKISYMLNKNADIKIYILNLANQIVKKFDIASGQSGGQAGYNQVEWNGVSEFSEILPNDVYFCRIVSDNKVIGKCKIAILR